MPSLYAQYAKELLNRSVIETDTGFVTYRYLDDNTVYIENIYVIPASRDARQSYELADAVAKLAKADGLTKMLGSVTPSAANSTISLKVLLSHGFKLKASANDIIYFEKELV